VLDLHGIPSLVLLYLSHNDISDTVAWLTRLVHVDIADNSLRGLVPAAVFDKLTDLLMLQLPGQPPHRPPSRHLGRAPCLAEFNTSENQLFDRVLDAMRTKFGLASFAGNVGLCPSS
jgi:hypothetical protein